MQQTIAESEQSLREIGYPFMAEKHRLSDLLLERREDFLRENLSPVQEEIREASRGIRTRYGPRYRRAFAHDPIFVSSS